MTEKNKTENITIESLIIEIKDTHSQCVIGEKQGTNNSVKLGRLSLNLKKEVKKTTGGRWQNYLRQNVPNLSIRSVQKYMKIASKIGSEEYPILYDLGLVRLHNLAELSEKLNIPEFLEKNGISLDVKDGFPIQLFKDRVTSLIKQIKGAKKTDPVVQFTKSVRHLEKCSASILNDKSLLFKVNISNIAKLETALSKIRKQHELLPKTSEMSDEKQSSGVAEKKIRSEEKIEKTS